MSATGAQEESEKNRQNRNFLLKNFVSPVDKSHWGDYNKCNITKMAVSGTFGVLYEFVDEAKYVIVPNTTNDSCLNPDEELTIIF